MAMPGTPDYASMMERLTDDAARLCPMWSRMVALLVENKARMGLAHLTDAEVLANAPSIFVGLMKLLFEASHDPAKAHRLTTFSWFLDHCASEIKGQPEVPVQH
jgi:hypothetical protein